MLERVAVSFSNACMHAKSLQSCPILCDPMDSSLPGTSVHRILQARMLEWVAISFSLLPSRLPHNTEQSSLFSVLPDEDREQMYGSQDGVELGD